MHTAKVLRIAGGTVSSAVSMFICLKLYAFQTALQHKQWRTQELFSGGGGGNKFSCGQRTGIWGR
jgi:hypothetical protein